MSRSKQPMTRTQKITVVVIFISILLYHSSSNVIYMGNYILEKTGQIYKDSKHIFSVLSFVSKCNNYFWLVFAIPLLIDKYYKDPREHIISVQMNVVTDSNTSSIQSTEDAWAGKLMWNVISEAPASDPAFQKLLRIARKKPPALIETCPTLGILDTGAYDVKSVLWQNIYGLASSLLCNTHALTRGACGLEVKRYRLIGCLTFESPEILGYNKARRKMRMLVVSRKQLKFLHDNPDYTYGKDSNSKEWARKWQNQRMKQLRELGRHVQETGGFDDSTYLTDSEVGRYYFEIEVWI